MELYKIILPKESICNETQLYYRAAPDNHAFYDMNSSRISMKKGTTLSFDTYFNCFPYRKYVKYTDIKNLYIRMELEGNFNINLYAVTMVDGGQRTRLLHSEQVELGGKGLYSFRHDCSTDSSSIIYYIELIALSDNAFFFGGSYDIDDSPEPRKVKIAAVICTYKREEYVYRNIGNFNENILQNEQNEIRNDIDIFVVDNGHTIDPSLIESDSIFVFRNKNYGGSGGFTRGIIEAYLRRDDYTHVLLMDDDILFESEIFKRTINYLKIVKNEYKEICLGAGMLREDMPWLQYESGAIWNGMRLKNLKHNIDMRDRANLALNEIEEEFNYSAWWYFCMPLSIIDENNLPLPLFIKSDDMEYSIRLRPVIVLMSGIGIWHEPFDFKYSAHLDYYCKRNEAILGAIHYPWVGPLHCIKKLLLAMGKQLLLHRYIAVDFLFRAYEDFLKGVDFFLDLDEEELNKELLSDSMKQLTNEELKRIGEICFDKNEYLNSLNESLPFWMRLLQILTINGYLIPKAFYNLKNKKNYKIVDVANCHVVNFFMADTVLHYNLHTGKGFVTKIDKSKLLTCGFRFLVLSARLIVRYNKAARSFRSQRNKISSLDFWSRHLDIDHRMANND